MKRILYILHAYYNRAGTEEHTRLLASGLKGDFEISLAFPDKGRVVVMREEQESLALPIENISWPVAPLRSKTVETALKRVLEVVAPDLVHIQHFIHWHLGLLSDLTKTGIPTFLSFHDYFPITPVFTGQGGIDPLETVSREYSQRWFGEDYSEYLLERRKILSAGMDGIQKRIVPSLFLSDALAKTFPGTYTVIPHGIKPFSPEPLEPHSGIRFGYVGSLLQQKGYRELVSAFRSVRSRYPETELYIFGDGDGSEKRELDGVKYFGSYSPEDLPSIFAAFDVGIIPSVFRETFCLSLSELMLSGKPVAASRIGALSERVNDGVTGKLFEPGDEADMIEKLSWFIENDSWRSWKIPKPRLASEMLDDYRSIYNEVLKS